MPPAAFVGHEIYRQPAYGRNHPLAIPRVEAAIDLCAALGWISSREFCASPRASEDELARFHSRGYIEALRQGPGASADARRRHALGTMENPLFPGLFERASTSVGGSIRAAQLALEGRLAFHPAGGTHHGRPDRASGFCYFNDPVFAILTLLDGGVERLLYVDLDAHHGDGVQDAFAHDPRVHTVSIHEQGRWPYTGAAHDTGGGRSRNLPVPRGVNDTELFFLVDEVVLPLAERLHPEAIVLTCGADALAGDPLSAMALSNVALWSVVRRLAALAPAAVVLGGGGYNPWTVARYWAGLWGVLSERVIPESLGRAARRVLEPLGCDLVDDEDVREEWRTTLADAPNPGTVRKEVHALV
jgi:acetoin utilization protein AcuC